MTSMTINGEAVKFDLDPATPLLWALRDAANLTGTKYGCDTAECGACIVLIDEQAVKSCGVTIGGIEGANVVTIEGLSPDRAHPVQQAWISEQVGQCGFCEPGLIISVVALLKSNPRPSEEQIAALPNICRCGVGPRLHKAIARAAAGLSGSATVPIVERSRSSRFSNGSSAEGQSPSQ